MDVEQQPIVIVARKVNEMTFAAPMVDDGSDEVRTGTIHMTHNYVGEVAPGSGRYQLNMKVEVRPSDGCEYYRATVGASAVFGAANGSGVREDEIRRAVLSSGADALYSYIGSVLSSVTQGGTYGQVILPLVSFEGD